jgi:hypothetical protein
VVIYQGTIGATGGGSALDPVDAGIGLAAWASCDCGGASTTLAGLTWDWPYGSDPNSEVSGATGTLVNFSTPYATAANFVMTSFCNPTSEDITIHVSVSMSGCYASGWVGLDESGPLSIWSEQGAVTGDFDIIAPANSVQPIVFEYDSSWNVPADSGTFTFTLSIR